MASSQTISSQSVNRSKVSGEIFCKVCIKECVIILSDSSTNPNKECYSCPIPTEQGAHGWMKWLANKRSMRANTVEHLGDNVAYCEAKLQLMEEILQMEHQRFSIMRGQLERERMRMQY